MAKTRAGNRSTARKAAAAVDSWHLDGNIAHLMSRLVNRLNMRLLEDLRMQNLTNQHFRIMQILYDADSVTIGELSRRVVIAQPVLSRILTQMEQRDLVRRQPNPNDSRYRHILLTAKGRATYEATWPTARRILEHATDAFTPDERTQFLGLLTKLDARLRMAPY